MLYLLTFSILLLKYFCFFFHLRHFSVIENSFFTLELVSLTWNALVGIYVLWSHPPPPVSPAPCFVVIHQNFTSVKSELRLKWHILHYIVLHRTTEYAVCCFCKIGKSKALAPLSSRVDPELGWRSVWRLVLYTVWDFTKTYLWVENKFTQHRYEWASQWVWK